MSSADQTRARLPEGKYCDRLRRGRGSVVDYGWRSNIVVDRCRALLSAFMRGNATAQGIQFLALGRGDAAWDVTPPPPPGAGTLALVDPAPVTIAVGDPALALAFVDAAGAEVAEPTFRLQVTLTLEGSALPIAADETFPLREFGLFGSLEGEHCMIDYVRHPVMHIGAADSLTRRIRLSF